MTRAEIEKPGEFDLGFVASRIQGMDGQLRLKLLGPLFEYSREANQKRFLAFRPFYSLTEDSVNDKDIQELLWPIGSAKRSQHESSWRLLTAYHWREDLHDPASRYHTWFLPLYFKGRNVERDPYTAFFPLGGKLYDFLGRDKITFFLFPLSAYSSINTVETRSFFWPLISRTKGKGIERFRIFPIYGRSKHRDKFEKHFVMWPIWTSGTYHYPASSGKGYIVFPLWGHIQLTDQESWMFLPPFFRYDRGKQLHRLHAPWPFIQISSGEVDKCYIVPLWGKKSIAGVKSWFFLWPIFRRETLDRNREITKRFRALPFWYSEVRERREHPSQPSMDTEKMSKSDHHAIQPRSKPHPTPLDNIDTSAVKPSNPTSPPALTSAKITHPTTNGLPSETIEVYRKFWPLGSYHRVKDRRRLRILDVWPTKQTGPMERNYTPLWTLYSRTCTTNASESELLWGLYRHRQQGESFVSRSLFPLFSWAHDNREVEMKKFSMLCGLIQIKREAEQTSWRLLYFLRWHKEK